MFLSKSLVSIMKNKEKIVKYTMLLIALIVIFILTIIFKDSLYNAIEKNFGAKNALKSLFKGLLNTFIITIFAFTIGLVLGFIVCLVLENNSKKTIMLIIKNVVKLYVDVFRGTPMMVQLLIIYFIVFASYKGSATFIAIISFGLNSGAYVSEILRGGINAIPVGQMEAGRSLGLSYSKVMGNIIFPQAMKNSLPSLGNEFITLIKETSVAGFVGAFDLTLAFRKIANATYDYTTVYLIMGLTYFIIVLGITKLFKLIERRLMKC